MLRCLTFEKVTKPTMNSPVIMDYVLCMIVLLMDLNDGLPDLNVHSCELYYVSATIPGRVDYFPGGVTAERVRERGQSPLAFSRSLQM